MIEIVTLKPEDARNFNVGMALVYDEPARRFRRETWRDRARRRLRRLLWWSQVRHETIAVDVARGSITQVALRWSWLRWCWVRSDT